METVALVKRFVERRKVDEHNAFLRTGIVAAAIINSNPYRSKGSKAVKPTDFVPREPKKIRQVTPEEGWRLMKSWAETQPRATPEQAARFRALKGRA